MFFYIVLASCTLFTFFFPRQTALAYTTHPLTSYAAMFKEYIVAFEVIDAYNKRVLGAQTARTPFIAKTADISTMLLNGVNAYRLQVGLPPVQTSPQVCSFAAIRAKEIATHFNHDGFNDRTASHTIPYIRWSRATENIATTPNVNEVVSLWANSASHAANMRDNTPYVCIKRYGNYYAYEGMRP